MNYIKEQITNRPLITLYSDGKVSVVAQNPLRDKGIRYIMNSYGEPTPRLSERQVTREQRRRFEQSRRDLLEVIRPYADKEDSA